MNIDLSAAAERIQSMLHGAVALLPNLMIAILVFLVFLVAARVVRVQDRVMAAIDRALKESRIVKLPNAA